jgi:hypothetical protein
MATNKAAPTIDQMIGNGRPLTITTRRARDPSLTVLNSTDAAAATL